MATLNLNPNPGGLAFNVSEVGEGIGRSAPVRDVLKLLQDVAHHAAAKQRSRADANALREDLVRAIDAGIAQAGETNERQFRWSPAEPRTSKSRKPVGGAR